MLTTGNAAIRPCRWRPFSPQTPVFYFWRPDRLTSIGSRAFPVAVARIWNTLPLHVTSASSLTAFKLNLKLHLFCFSFPGLSPLWLLSGPCSVCCHLGHYKNFDWLIDWLIEWKMQDWKMRSKLQSGKGRSLGHVRHTSVLNLLGNLLPERSKK